MYKAVVISNEKQNKEISETTISILDSIKDLCSFDAMYPINVEYMIGSIKEILNETGTYIRSADFPNIIWIYGENKNNPLQLEIINTTKAELTGKLRIRREFSVIEL